MRQAATTMIGGLFLALLPVAPAFARPADSAATLAQAKRLVEAKSYSQAATLLEDQLPEADAKERRPILELLRQSYEAMAREAKAAGNDREAAQLLDDIAIIDRSSRTAPDVTRSGETTPAQDDAATKEPVRAPKAPRALSATGSPRMSPSPSLVTNAPSKPAKKPTLETFTPVPNLLDMSSSPMADSTTQSPPTALAQSAAGEKLVAVDPKSPSDIGAPETSPRAGDGLPQPPAATLAEGDRLFAAGRYDEAGKCYAALSRQDRLPAHRKEHWAYCRMVDVARRVNLRPQSAQEWEAIATEIANIQRLSPNIWYGEYLRNKIAEVRRKERGTPAKSDNLIVRASAPDESQQKPDQESRRFPRLFGKSRPSATAQPDAKAAAASASPTADLPLKLPGGSSEPPTSLALDAGGANDPAPSGEPPVARSEPPTGTATNPAGNDAAAMEWEIYETPNFRVFHQNARLAEAAGNAAESVRTAQAKRWASPVAQRPWTPRCDLYLYPNGKVFARETKQPETSPGFSTMNCKGDRVVARRVNLRADHPLLVTAILPHEVTHVVLADLFPIQQIPRWADEGIAVLAEPKSEQEMRAAELQEPLETGRVFNLRKLMAMDYPQADDTSLYYAQSVSLTRFLVERGAPEKFVQFVQNSQREGIEGALRGTYGIADLAELQDRWTEYARERFTAIKEARRDPSSQPGGGTAIK
jgi:hypothetical protein